MKENKPELDLSERNCHVCGRPMGMDIKNQTMRCVYYGCKIKNVDFSIPVKLEQKK